MLYSLNRWENKKRIMNCLNRVDVLVADRYTPSNLAYGTAHGLRLRWLVSLDKGLPRPDVVVVINVPVPSSFERKMRDRDIHETNRDFLLQVKRSYLRLAGKYHWKVVKGVGTAKQIHENIWKTIQKSA